MTWEYLAGFFDGEGCIHYANRPYGRYVHMHVSQGHVNESASQVLHKVFEFLRTQGIPVRYAEHKGDGKVIATNVPALTAWLNGMLPYLIVKKAKAIEALAFAQTINQRRIDRRIAIAA